MLLTYEERAYKTRTGFVLEAVSTFHDENVDTTFTNHQE